jgi:thiol-disulfide isomerase/thioredoxin
MTDTIDKNIINLTIYEKNGLRLYAYTALWCGPCKKIKPKMIEIMSKHEYLVMNQESLEKQVFKKEINEFVPFFIVKKGTEKVDSIQTSNEILFTQFLTKNNVTKMELDDNF